MSAAVLEDHDTSTETTTGFTPYRYGEDYPDDADLCFDLEIVADRVFVCTRPTDHNEEDHRLHRAETHGYVRMHRDPDITYSGMAMALETDLDLMFTPDTEQHPTPEGTDRP